MQINGQWLVCDDGGTRPVVRGEIQAQDGTWKETVFLVDTGADRTVLTADILTDLEFVPVEDSVHLAGVGGRANSVLVNTQLRFQREDGSKITFKGQFAAFTEAEALDMSVLGRDITNLFAVIVDRPKDRVCFLGQKHTYVIQHTN